MNFKCFIAIIGVSLTSVLSLSAQMSDSQVVSFVQESVASGKSRNQIASELISRGVSSEQSKRIMSDYQSGKLNLEGAGLSKTVSMDSVVRERSMTVLQKGEQKQAQKQAQKQDIPSSDRQIFGHTLFNNSHLTFEPNDNMATPADYVLGPGDEIIIDVWGLNENTIREKISPEGKIFISQIGPISLSGLTIDEAQAGLVKALSQKYSLDGPEAASQISVTLGNIRSIQVNVLGEVNVPGTYRLSSFTTVFNALFRAGGVTDIGSLRMVQIARGGKIVGFSDIYKYLFDGNSSTDISLKDGDAVIVPSYSALVEAGNGFIRPMYYEVIPGESVSELLRYAGGFDFDASEESVSIERKDGESSKVFTVKKTEYASFGLQNGDVINPYLNPNDVYVNKVEVKGSVLRPGIYSIGGEITTVRELVTKSGGLLDDAMRSRAQLIREKQDRSLEVKAIAIGAIMDGICEDIPLRTNDVLMVSNVNEICPKGDISISGYVAFPGNYQFAEGMGIEDIIMMAGGLEDGASSVNVEVARRILDPYSREASDTLARIFSCRIEDGMMVDGAPDFTLEPYDVVAVRKSPAYSAQKKVLLAGEVTFPGEYVLMANNERLSDLYRRAGGATPNGYIEGASIRRKESEDLISLKESLLRSVQNIADSTALKNLARTSFTSLGINLEKAIADPGGEYDIILQDGDEIIIPQNTNIVGVIGEVLFPNSVSYQSGKTLKYYIGKAGGYSQKAKRSKVCVVYLNGEAAMGRDAVIKPGCEIFVPSRPEHRQLSVGEWMSIGTSAASLTTMIATIANLIK